MKDFRRFKINHLTKSAIYTVEQVFFGSVIFEFSELTHIANFVFSKFSNAHVKIIPYVWFIYLPIVLVYNCHRHIQFRK